MLIEGYNQPMARGWESKSVEAQQDEASARDTAQKPRLTREAETRLREKESLRLSRRRVIEQIQRSHHARHRAMLEHALADLERKIEALGGEVR
jgi:iron-sulfur cluster repair protein YtfE (RIC family)